MGTEHATVRMGLARAGFERGMTAAGATMRRFASISEAANKAVSHISRGLAMVGIAGGGAALAMAVRGMRKLADDTWDARREIDKLVATGADIPPDLLSKSLRIDDETLYRIRSLSTEWDKFADSLKSSAAGMFAGGAMSVSAWIGSMISGIDAGLIKSILNTTAVAQGKTEEATARQEAIKTEVAKLETKILALQIRQAEVLTSDSDKLDALRRVQEQMADQHKTAATDQAEAARRYLASQELALEIAELEVKVQKEKATVLEAQARLSNQINAAAKRESSEKTDLKDRSASSLESIAGAAVYTREGARQRWAAGQVLRAEAFARQARIEGRPDLESDAMAYADKLRKGIGGLSTADMNPQELLVNIQMQMEELQLLANGKNGGMHIKPTNSE